MPVPGEQRFSRSTARLHNFGHPQATAAAVASPTCGMPSTEALWVPPLVGRTSRATRRCGSRPGGRTGDADHRQPASVGGRLACVGVHPCRSGAGQVADGGGLRPFSWWLRPVWGRRVCGVAVKAERPQAKPRTNGLEGGVVRAMLVEPGRGNVRNQGGRSRAHHGQTAVAANRVRLPVIHPPRDMTGEHDIGRGHGVRRPDWAGSIKSSAAPPAVGSQTPYRPRAQSDRRSCRARRVGPVAAFSVAFW
jgi:hypothetical protein